VKRPLFVTTVPRGIFLQPQPIVREIVAKARQIFTYASHPRILDQRQRREILSKQSSINSTFNQLLNRNNVNIISKNIKSFDDQVDARCDRVNDDSMCKVTGVKIARTRYDAYSSLLKYCIKACGQRERLVESGLCHIGKVISSSVSFLHIKFT
jgi:hypothetical protein